MELEIEKKERKEKEKKSDDVPLLTFFSSTLTSSNSSKKNPLNSTQIPRRVVRAQDRRGPRAIIRRPTQSRGQQLLEGRVDVRGVRGGERGGAGARRAAAVMRKKSLPCISFQRRAQRGGGGSFSDSPFPHCRIPWMCSFLSVISSWFFTKKKSGAEIEKTKKTVFFSFLFFLS